MTFLTSLDSDAHLRETLIEGAQVYAGHFLDVRRDRIALPDGTASSREYIVHPGAAMVLPLRDDGRAVTVRQWRYPMARAFVEFPAGKIDAGESPWHCAIRELQEETGYVAVEWARAGILHNAIAYSTEGIDIWFARGLTAGPARPDTGEFLDIGDASFDELNDLAGRGELTDAKTLIGLLWWQRWLDGRWPLVWRAPPVAERAGTSA